MPSPNIPYPNALVESLPPNAVTQWCKMCGKVWVTSPVFISTKATLPLRSSVLFSSYNTTTKRLPMADTASFSTSPNPRAESLSQTSIGAPIVNV